jgi:hypothetical protein
LDGVPDLPFGNDGSDWGKKLTLMAFSLCHDHKNIKQYVNYIIPLVTTLDPTPQEATASLRRSVGLY